MILTPLQKLANNVGDLGKIIVATSFEWLPKVQKIAKSGHTAPFTKMLYGNPPILNALFFSIRSFRFKDAITSLILNKVSRDF